jgi:hypothetical protein
LEIVPALACLAFDQQGHAIFAQGVAALRHCCSSPVRELNAYPDAVKRLEFGCCHHNLAGFLDSFWQNALLWVKIAMTRSVQKAPVLLFFRLGSFFDLFVGFRSLLQILISTFYSASSDRDLVVDLDASYSYGACKIRVTSP